MSINRRVFTYLAIALISVVYLTSCVPSKPVKEERITSSTRLIKKLEANRRKIKTFKGSGSLNISTIQMDAKASFEVILKKPDTVRVSIFGPFGIDLAQALVTKKDFKFYDVLNNRLYKGVNHSGIIKKILKIDLSFKDLIDAFAGAINLTDKLAKEPDQFSTEGNGYILKYLENDKVIIYNVNSSDLAITNYRLFTNKDKLLFEGKYKDFELFNTVPVPYSTVVTDKTNNQSIKINYRNIDINQTLNHVDIDVPNDTRTILW